MEKVCSENEAVLTVTDGLRTVRLPFSPGEDVLTVLRRYLRFAAPCGGNGYCGQCRFDIEKRTAL